MKSCEDCDHLTGENTCEVTGEKIINKYEKHECVYFLNFYDGEEDVE